MNKYKHSNPRKQSRISSFLFLGLFLILSITSGKIVKFNKQNSLISITFKYICCASNVYGQWRNHALIEKPGRIC